MISGWLSLFLRYFTHFIPKFHFYTHILPTSLSAYTAYIPLVTPITLLFFLLWNPWSVFRQGPAGLAVRLVVLRRSLVTMLAWSG